MIFDRRTFAGLIAATAAGIAAGVRPAVAADAVRIGTIPIDPASECFYAQERGAFSRAGLDASIQTFSSGGAVAAGIVGGAIDVGNVDLVTVASAHARGVPLVVLAPAGVYTQAAQTYVLLVKQDSPIKGARDLAGKTIAVNGLKNINQIPTEAWIDNNGGDAKSAKFIEMPFPAMVPALEDGKIDAAAVTEPTLAITAGKYRVIALNEKNLAPTFMVAGWTARRDWVERNRDAARRYANVMFETAKWANANHAESADILTRATKLPLAIAQKMQRAYYGERMDAALIQPVIDATAKYGVIDKPFPASAIMA